MRLVITGGILRGRVLKGRVGPGIRPTAARVREAMFSVLGQDLSGWTVLDAYAGSGLLGFEAHSRGGQVTFVEKDPRARKEIKQRADALGVVGQILAGVTPKALGSGTWDLVLADPPYAIEPAGVVQQLAPHVERLLVLEHAAEALTPDRFGSLLRDPIRQYGDTALSVYRSGPEGAL